MQLCFCFAYMYLCWVFGSLEWCLEWLEDLGRVGRVNIVFTGAAAAFELIACPIYYNVVTFWNEHIGKMGGTQRSFASPFDDRVPS